MNDPPCDLAAWRDRIWRALVRAAADPGAPGRHPVLATAGLGGGAEARTVGLKGARRASATVTVQSDAGAGKVAELARDPAATLLFWDPQAQQQLRLRVRVTIAAGAATGTLWDMLPEPARIHYGRRPVPATPIPRPDAFEPAPDRNAFAVLTCRIEEIEALFLHADLACHRRALYRRAEDWAGAWLCP